METDQIDLLSFVPGRHKRKDGSVHYTLRDSSGTKRIPEKGAHGRETEILSILRKENLGLF
jgi:hypothetical protein